MSDFDTDNSVVENDGDQTHTNTEYVQVRKADLEDIHLQLEEIRSMNMSARQKAAPQVQHVEEELPYIPAEVIGDPQKLALFIKKTTEKATAQAQKTISTEAQKATWDQKATQDFPLGDAEFSKAVKAQIRELTSTGEYSAEHPMLVYRAAQLAGMKLKASGKKSGSTEEAADAEPRPTSVAAGSGGGSGSAPRSRSKIADNHPTVRAYKMFNPKATKEDVEKLKSSLEKQGTRIERRDRSY